MNHEIPKITACSASHCGYNHDMKCHAFAVTVGGPHQACDTYEVTKEKGGYDDMSAEIGACKVTGCAHNKAMLCSAVYVSIGMHGMHADCETFREKQG